MANKTLAQKTNTSSIQVIKTLKVLLQGDYTMQELIEILNKNESDAIFNNSVISKYINTCRFCEFDIPKIHNKYYVAKIPFKALDISFSFSQSSLHLYLRSCSTSCHPSDNIVLICTSYVSSIRSV